MINVNASNVKQTVREYYSFMGDKKVKVIRLVKNKYSDYDMLLVQFTDRQNKEMSALLYYQEWKSGKLDVTEMTSCERENEATMVKDFEESEEYRMVVEKCHQD